MVATAPFLDRVVEILTSNLPPNELVEVKATPDEQERLIFLTNKNKEGVISKAEEEELDAILFAEHLMILAKVKALKQLRAA